MKKGGELGRAAVCLAQGNRVDAGESSWILRNSFYSIAIFTPRNHLRWFHRIVFMAEVFSFSIEIFRSIIWFVFPNSFKVQSVPP